MPALRHSSLRTAVRAGTMAVVALIVLLAAGNVPASAETVGGEQLARSAATVALGPGARPLPRIRAATGILADASTGEGLAQKGSHERRAPASTLKMLTALTVMPRTTPQDTYVATARAASVYGSRVGLRPGRAYTLEQLWYAVFLPSANDAAIAVAEANGGVRRTVRQMNEVAHELRALDTVARNPHGLDAKGQVSSAYDLALIARAGLVRPDFATYAAAARAPFPDVKGRGSHSIYTTNRLLLHGWRGAIGVKTGYTTKAGRTYVGAAKRGGRTLIVALMGVREPSEDAARKLLAWGFANADRVTPVGQLVEPGSPVPGVMDAAEALGTAGAAADQAGSGGDGTTTTAAERAQQPNRRPTAGVAGGLARALAAATALVLVRRRTYRSGAERELANQEPPVIDELVQAD